VLEQKAPLYLPKDHPWIQMLLDVYHDCTGLPAYTMSMGGGTYARALKNAVAFGCGFPDSAHGHNAHAPNEFFPIDDMVRACKVFARLFEAAQQLELNKGA
jgi:acetylornithine deacetylase/succinyl-diaminopimelate desuccinylase-like protein